MSYMSVSEAADFLHVRPQDISRALYQRRLRTDLCRKIGGRWLIPEPYLPFVAAELSRPRTPSVTLPIR